MNVLSNIMNWDPVAWMSMLMVVIAIVIVVFLYFKVSADEAGRRGAQEPEGPRAHAVAIRNPGDPVSPFFVLGNTPVKSARLQLPSKTHGARLPGVRLQ
jgi:hypothetical protein